MQNFKIPSVPRTTIKSVRFPQDVVQQVEQQICGTDCTFSAFVVHAVRFAIEDMAHQHQEKEEIPR